MAKRRKRQLQRLEKENDLSVLTGLAKDDPTAKERGAIIQAAMVEKHLTAPDIAKKIGISFPLFMLFMAGKANIGGKPLDALSELLGVERDQLMTAIPESTNEVIEKAENEMRNVLKNAKDFSEENSKEENAGADASGENTEESSEENPGENPQEVSEENASEDTPEETPEYPAPDAEHTEETADAPAESGRAETADDDLPWEGELKISLFDGDDNEEDVSLPWDEDIEENSLEKDSDDRFNLDEEEYRWKYGCDFFEEEEEYIPSNEELHALLVLCSDTGKAKVYDAVWKILQDPICRKGGAV